MYNFIFNIKTKFEIFFISSIEPLLIPAVIFFLLSFLVKKTKILNEFAISCKFYFENICLIFLNNIILIPIYLVYSNYFYIEENIIWNNVPFSLIILLTLLCGDFIGYWRHRLEHSRLLWPSHIVHHSDEKMSWLTLQRFHPINRITTLFFDGTLLFFLGFPLEAIAINGFVRHYYGYFIHADLPWTYGVFCKIFVSPAMHRWHHAMNKEFHNSNFASLFSFIDVIFGTYKVPGICEENLGVSYMKNKSLIKQLIHPFTKIAYSKKKL